MSHRAIFSCGVSAAALLISCPARAQQAGGAEQVAQAPTTYGATPPSATPGIEQIIVTARRREENIQKVPVAITAVTPETLQKENVTSLQDVARLVPGLSTYSPYVTDTYVILRGQGSYLPTGVPAVTSYFDEVPLPGLIGGPGFFYDLQGVQVLKGAQGTLFGRNSTGGAVLQETAQPENRFGGYVQAGAGNYSNFDATGAINFPIVDNKVLLRVAFNYQRRDGYTHDLTVPGHPNGIDLDNRNLKAGRATLLLKPVQGVTNETVVDAYSFKDHGENNILAAVNPGFFDSLAGLFGPVFAGQLKQQWLGYLASQQSLGVRTQLASSVDAPNSKKSISVINKTSISLSDNLILKNIAAYIRVSSEKPFEGDGTASANIDYGPVISPNVAVQYTEELQLQGKAFDDRLKYTAGLFYLDAPKTPIGIVDRVVFFGFSANQEQTRLYETSKAVFGQVTYTIVNGLNFTAGARYTSDSRTGQSRLLDSAVPGGPYICDNPPIGPGNPGYNAADPCLATKTSKSKRLTGNLSLDYQIKPNLMVYAAARRGYRAGGPNVQTILPQNASYRPEDLTDFELGLKSDFRLGDVPVRANLAVYHSRVTGLQVSSTIVEAPRPNTPINLVQNVASPANFNGAEAELTARLTPELSLYASGAYVDLHAALPANVVRSFSKYTANLGLDYTHELHGGAGTLDFNVSGYWRSKLWIAESPGPSALQPGYGLVNASLGWNHISGTRLDAQAYVTNLFNKTYGVGAYEEYNALGYTSVTYGEPRIFGARLRYSF